MWNDEEDEESTYTCDECDTALGCCLRSCYKHKSYKQHLQNHHHIDFSSTKLVHCFLCEDINNEGRRTPIQLQTHMHSQHIRCAFRINDTRCNKLGTYASVFCYQHDRLLGNYDGFGCCIGAFGEGENHFKSHVIQHHMEGCVEDDFRCHSCGTMAHDLVTHIKYEHIICSNIRDFESFGLFCEKHRRSKSLSPRKKRVLNMAESPEKRMRVK